MAYAHSRPCDNNDRTPMNKPLAITARQITALCKGAEKAGYAPIVQIGNIWVRLVPEEHAIPPQPKNDVDEPEEIDL